MARNDDIVLGVEVQGYLGEEDRFWGRIHDGAPFEGDKKGLLFWLTVINPYIVLLVYHHSRLIERSFISHDREPVLGRIDGNAVPRTGLGSNRGTGLGIKKGRTGLGTNSEVI